MKIDFYKVQSLPETLNPGGVYFDVSDNLIKVAISEGEYTVFPDIDAALSNVNSEFDSVNAKLDTIVTTGDGTKFLSDNGTYKTISNSSSGESSSDTTGTILYDVNVDNANFYDITISQSAENFTKFDICACTDTRELTFISVYNPNNNNFNIYSMTQESGELIIKTKQFRVSGDYISQVNGIGGMSSISSNGIIVNSGNYIGIYKIVGYA